MLLLDEKNVYFCTFKSFISKIVVWASFKNN